MESMKLLMSANADILTFSMSFYYGIIQKSGAFWLAPHSIEKYFKAILTVKKPKVDLKKLGHDLYKLDQEIRSVFSMPDYITTLVNNLDGIDIDFRYGSGSGYEFPNDLFYKIWVTGRWLRITGNQLFDISNDKMFGVGMGYASSALRTENHDKVRKLINEFEKNTKNGKDYNVLKGWVDISAKTKTVFNYYSIRA